MARRLSVCLCCLGFALLATPDSLLATDPIVRVEEDWELLVGTPDPKVVGPQVTCVLSPVGNADGLHAIFNLNHQSYEQFVPGGMQLQVWQCETPLTNRKHPDESVLSVSGEFVRWTQTMEVGDGQLRFSIENGASTTWGAFGHQGYLRAAVPTSLADLNDYNPTVSLANSGAGFASNRVESLTLKRIRVFTKSGHTATIVLNKTVEH